MEQIQQLITFMLVIIPVGAAVRIGYCLIVLSMDSEEERSYKVRIRNVIVFTVLAETIAGLLKVVLNYF